MNGPSALLLVQNALLAAFWLSVPLLAAISAAGLAGGMLQGVLGNPDAASLVGSKLLAAGLAFLFFGAWMLSFSAAYWRCMWLGAASLVR